VPCQAGHRQRSNAATSRDVGMAHAPDADPNGCVGASCDRARVRALAVIVNRQPRPPNDLSLDGDRGV
jgi:hypothetical protein